MKKFIIKTITLLAPILLILISIEIYLRYNNTFYAKKNNIIENKKSIEVLILGSSHPWRSINPELMTIPSASLAHEGSSFNIDHLLFKEFIGKLPNLKVVFLETSYHTFELYRAKDWNKNHLFWIYYGVNNYEGSIPLSDYFLITSNFKHYIKKLLSSSNSKEFSEFNEYGFITTEKRTLASSNYDSLTLKKKHSQSNLYNYKKSKILLDEIIDICEEKKIDLIFLSPPKYYSYNNNNNVDKLARRDSVFSKYQNNDFIHIWNQERMYEKNDKLFYNENHMNIYGAKKFTNDINIKLNQIIKRRRHNNVSK